MTLLLGTDIDRRFNYVQETYYLFNRIKLLCIGRLYVDYMLTYIIIIMDRRLLSAFHHI